MQDIATKTDGSQLTAGEFNQIPSEIENAIISTGQTLTNSNLEQLATSLAIYSSKGDFYSTSGTANAITLSPISSMKSISSYSLGTKVRFIANSNNSDVVTIAISNLTSVNLLNSSGSPLIANELLQGYEYTATFDGTNFRLVSNYNSVQAQLDIKANDSEVVHLVDNETISDIKTFSSSPQVPNVTSGDSSTNSANTKFVTTAVNNLQSQVNSNFVNLTGTQTITGTKTFSNTIQGSINGNAVTVTNGVYTSGNQTIAGQKTFSSVAYGTASDANNSILTTIAKSKAANGYFKLGNGLIVQWGRSNSKSETVTLPTPFSNTNYSITYSQHTGTSYTQAFTTKTTTTFWHGDSATVDWIAIGY